jgi:hypothetical protein
MEFKKCSKCGLIKPVSEFNKHSQTKDGLQSICKQCQTEYNRQWRLKHPDYNQQYLIANREKCNERKKQWRATNRKKINETNRRWYAANPEKYNKLKQQWKAANPEKVRETKQRWYIKHPEKTKAMWKRSSDKRRSSTKGKLNHSMSSRLRLSLKKNAKSGQHWESLVGYTVQQLKKHLEKKFQLGMTWENYGYGVGKWNIDHIVPVAAFNFETTQDFDFRSCWALKNLQPMWQKENMKKSNKLNKSFQPSLLLQIQA